jgi:hypothetical protein
MVAGSTAAWPRIASSSLTWDEQVFVRLAAVSSSSIAISKVSSDEAARERLDDA